MAMTARIDAAIAFIFSNAIDLGSREFPLRADRFPPIELGDGTGAGQASKPYVDTKTIAASGSEDLDLAAGVTNPFGSTFTFATVKAILVKASAANTNNVVIGGAAANAFVGPFGAANDVVSVKPGGVALFVAPGTGWTVTADTGDILKLANSGAGTGVDFDIVILGT